MQKPIQAYVCQLLQDKPARNKGPEKPFDSRISRSGRAEIAMETYGFGIRNLLYNCVYFCINSQSAIIKVEEEEKERKISTIS